MTKSDASLSTEEVFPIRSYGKGELACLYIHNVQQASAVKEFNIWIRKAPGLEQKLLETGMSRSARRYTPKQVRLIVEALGEPKSTPYCQTAYLWGRAYHPLPLHKASSARLRCYTRKSHCREYPDA